jgi:hypothetical protein
MAISAVPSAATSALAGIRAASERLDASAATLSSAVEPQRGDTVTLSAASRRAASSGGEAGAIAGAIVDSRIAKYQNAASISVLRTADDMTADLLRLGARDQA